MSIIGIPVATPLPKPNLNQTDPTKGDYIIGSDRLEQRLVSLEGGGTLALVDESVSFMYDGVVYCGNLSSEFPLVDDETYTVVIDGVTYTAAGDQGFLYAGEYQIFQHGAIYGVDEETHHFAIYQGEINLGGEYVSFSPQNLTEEQQVQARENIGAAPNIVGANAVDQDLVIQATEWDKAVSFRHIWFPIKANRNFTIKTVSWRAKVNNGWVDSTQNFHVELLESDGVTALAAGECDYTWTDSSTLCDFSVNLNGVAEAGKTYYLHIYCKTRSFSFRDTAGKTYTDEYLTTISNSYTSNTGSATFGNVGNPNAFLALSCGMTVSAVQAVSMADVAAEVFEVEKRVTALEPEVGTVLLVSPTYTAATEGFGVTKFNTMLAAYESIPYNNTAKYVIRVADGTYTDMQALYAGVDGDTYQGIVLGNHYRNNVTFESASGDPTKCIIEWDGGTGYTGDLVNANVVNKCAFHINGGVGWEIRGFTFIGKNLRYCLHSETNSKTSCLIENCIFDWRGKDCTDYNQKGPVVGMGGTYYDFITFRNCKFLNSESTMGVQWHDNNPAFSEDLMLGAILRFEDCYFDGLDIMPRSTMADRVMPFSLELVRCGGLRTIYPNIGGAGTANYWRATVESCLIDDDKFKDCDSTTTFADLTELKV